MARRLPSQPPTLPGFSFVRVLGSGGFADVFLYEQNSPRRQVAIKVMLAEYVNNEVRDMFQAEADLMAQLSAHPSILTVYQSGIAADGRPYLVMELCSASIGHEYRERPLPVADVLRIGIKIASATEMAHRSGVLHRDIKPSNILMTAYGNPVLSDFGIAGRVGETQIDESLGMSIPWSSPEVLNNQTNGTVQSEIWALAATLYSFLAGRSPFEIPWQSNRSADLISRIMKGKPQPIDRTDVPEQLELVLLRCMSRRPEARPQSAMEFIHALQTVESELGYTPTQPDVAVDVWATAAVDDPGDRTRVSPVRTVDPGRRRRRAAKEPAAGADQTVKRQGRDLGPTPLSDRSAPAVATPHSRTFVAVILACSVLVLALAITTIVVLTRSGASAEIPKVANVQAEVADGSVVFSWADPGVEADDTYQIRTSDGETSIQRSTEFTVTAEAGENVCVTVAVNRNGSVGDPSSEKCMIAPEGSG
ncbi:hypothetical protein GCM10027416_07350 [Okibacterium endophyticum]